MAVRIRYKDLGEHLVSIYEVISDRTGARYKVTIFKESKTYEIKNVLTYRTYRGGDNINNMNVLKRVVKKHLEALGCKFGEEKRDRLFGLCEKGYTNEKHIKKLKEQQSLTGEE